VTSLPLKALVIVTLEAGKQKSSTTALDFERNERVDFV
jgi:hypothetical protein